MADWWNDDEVWRPPVDTETVTREASNMVLAMAVVCALVAIILMTVLS